MASPDEPSYDEIMGRDRWRFTATGNTYHHRDTFKSYAWRWNPEKKAWTLDEDAGIGPDDLTVVRIRNLPRVRVVGLNVDTGEVMVLKPTREVR